MADAKVLYVVGTVCKDPKERSAFKSWYIEHHIPEVASKTPGVIKGTVYEVVAPAPGGPEFMAIYELEEDAVGTFSRWKEWWLKPGPAPFTTGPEFTSMGGAYVRRT